MLRLNENRDLYELLVRPDKKHVRSSFISRNYNLFISMSRVVGFVLTVIANFYTVWDKMAVKGRAMQEFTISNGYFYLWNTYLKERE